MRRQLENCRLCIAVRNEPDLRGDLAARRSGVKVLETKNLKGHARRIMAVSMGHFDEGTERRIIAALTKFGMKVFAYTPKFVIMVMVNGWASIPDHPHLVATDLDPRSDDFQQVLATPWLKVVDTDCEATVWPGKTTLSVPRVQEAVKVR